MGALSAGLIAAATGLKASLAGFGRWRLATRRLRARLEAARAPLAQAPVDLAALDALPQPVQRWLRQALCDGQPPIETVDVRHRGEFNTARQGERWRRFRSAQRVTIARPGFDWDARIAFLPGVAVHVHDAYIGGRGLLRAAVGGLVNVVDLDDGGALAAGELMRWAAEAAWYPTALLPGERVQWRAHDDRSAGLRIADGEITVELTVGFDAAGLLETVRAEDRGRLVNGTMVPTPWQGRFWDHRRVDGMLIPHAAEVAWLLPEGPQPYWRGRIESIAFGFAG